jgi:hypothetical protein
MKGDGADGDDDKEHDVEEVYDASQPTQCRQSTNYTDIENTSLVTAWRIFSLDAVTSNDQTGKRYWQHIDEKFFHFLALVSPITSTRTKKSLQGRWDGIKSTCSQWSACLEMLGMQLPADAPPMIM